MQGNEQWGTYSYAWHDNGGTSTHSFPIAFSTSCYAVVGIAVSSAGAEWRNSNEISAKTTSNFTWRRSYEEAGSCMIVAFGV